MSAAALPVLFIASSTEGLPVAFDLQEALEHDCHATVWKQGVARPSRTVLEDLLARLREPQFALFVFTPDDTLLLRGATHRVARDNVVFEMGLFIGALGLPRCMHLVPRGVPDLQLPSDLLGLTALDYPADRPDGNRLAALGPACNKIRRRLREMAPALGARTAAASRDPFPGPAIPPAGLAPDALLRHYLDAWDNEPLASDRALLRAGVPLDPYDDDLPRASLRRVFNFLESVSDAVLSSALDEALARVNFGHALLSFWPLAYSLLAPPNHGDEFWDPAPAIANLCRRWK